jgi:hypothetical protein
MDGGFGSPGRLGRDGMGSVRDSRTLTWDRNPKPDRSDPKYFPVNSLPRQRVPNTTLSPPRDDWTTGRAGDPTAGGYNYGVGPPHSLPPAHRDLYGVSGGGLRDMPPPMHALPSYQPPPPVVTEQPRTAKEPTHFRDGTEQREKYVYGKEKR